MFNQEIETIRASIITIRANGKPTNTITESQRQFLFDLIKAARVNVIRQNDALALRELDDNLNATVAAIPSADPIPSAALGTEQGAAYWRGTGERPKNRAEKILAMKAWDNLDRWTRPLLPEWLEDNFGLNADGSLSVAESTFYGWRKLVENS